MKTILFIIAGITLLMPVGAEVNVPTDESSKILYDPRAKSEMDDLAGPEEVAKLPGDWLLFVEDRAHSIRKTTGLPKRWLNNLPGHTTPRR
jgi:hypothetical protein